MAQSDAKDIIGKFVSEIDDSDLIFEKRNLSENTENLERKLKRKLPNSFRYLISNYAFVPFIIEPIYFFANNREGYLSEDYIPIFYDEVEPSKSDLSNLIFQDKFLYKVLSENSFIQFARPSDESYDPICLDAREKKSDNEFPIVRLDHEEILCNENIEIIQNISNSFYEFVFEFIKGK